MTSRHEQVDGFLVGHTTFLDPVEHDEAEGVTILLDVEVAEILRQYLQQSGVGGTRLFNFYSALRQAIVALGTEPNGHARDFELHRSPRVSL